MIERLESRRMLSAELRINSGGGAFVDSSGHSWSADAFYHGGTAKTWPFAVQGSADPALLTARRGGKSFGYTIPLDSGDYTVTILAVEPFFTVPGQRVFDVYAQNKKVIAGLDLVAAAGAKTAVQRSFSVHVNTSLNLQFTGLVAEATVSAIDINPMPILPPLPPRPIDVAVAWNSDKHVIVNWGAGGGVYDGFRIQRQADGGKFITLATVGSDGFVDETVKVGHHYAYRVYEFNAAGFSHPSNLATLSTTAPPTKPSPFKGVPFQVGQLIQSEDFDQGGDGISYHDSTPASASDVGLVMYRRTPVDLEATDWEVRDNYAINNTDAGDWLDYTISVPTTGAYTLTTHAAAPAGDNAKIHYDLDGKKLTPSILLNVSANFDTYVDTARTVTLPAGTHVLRMVLETGGDNFDWIRITPLSTKSGNPSAAAPTNNSIQTGDWSEVKSSLGDLLDSTDYPAST